MYKLIPNLNAKLIIVQKKGIKGINTEWVIRDCENLTICNGRFISNIMGWRYDRFERVMKNQFNALGNYHSFNKERDYVFWLNKEDAQKALDYLESQRMLQRLSI